MNKIAGVMGNAPMAPAFFLFLVQNIQVQLNMVPFMAPFRVATPLPPSAGRWAISP